MKYNYLTVDGMLSGTGIRDSVNGGYVQLEELNLPQVFINRIEIWLSQYEDAHYSGFNDICECDALDIEGVAIGNELQRILAPAKIEYYSNVRLYKIPLEIC